MAWSKADAWMVDYLVRVHHFDPRREDMRIEDGNDHTLQGDVRNDDKYFRKEFET
jgi:hypothetical protein